MTREERKKAIEVLDDMKVKIDIPKAAKTQKDRNWALDMAIQALEKENIYDDKEHYVTISKALYDKLNIDYEALSQEPCTDAVSREWLKKKLQEHHDFFVNAYGGFKNMPQTEKARVDEIIHCIAEVVNAPSVNPQHCEDAVSRASVIKFEGTNMACMGGDEIMKEFENNTQQPCDDAISREDAITSINKLYEECEEWRALNDLQYGKNQGLSLAIDVIEDLSPVTPSCDKCAMNGSGSKYCDNCRQKSGKWIPVSERLPEAEYGESDSVLVCFENETQDVLYFDGSNWRYPTGEIYISVNHKNGWHNKVVAWMPLPKPYKPQERSE